MKITIEGTPKEVKELLQTVDCSEEQKKDLMTILNGHSVSQALTSNLRKQASTRSLLKGN